MASKDTMDGLYGWADVPAQCPHCGGDWSAGERVQTGDEAGIGGFEDWMYCGQCKAEVFFPVIHRPESSNMGVQADAAPAAVAPATKG